MAVVETDADGTINKRSIRKIEYPLDTSPVDLQFKDLVGSIVEELYGKSQAQESATESASGDSFDLPAQIDGLADQHASPLENAARLQLVALLTPKSFEYERRRLFERSLLAIDGIDSGLPHVDLLRARAYYHLSRRPVAMDHLKSAKSAAELALKAYINGNYPELKRAVGEIDQPIFQVMSLLEMKSLAYLYQKDSKQEIEVAGGNAGWNQIVDSAGRDGDAWYVPDNMTFFRQLNGLFPRFDQALARIFSEKVVSGPVEGRTDFEKLFESVFASSLSDDKSGNCCMSYEGHLEVSDIWQLYRNLATANLLRNLERSVNVHASYKTAVDYAEKLLPLLEGHPAFTRLYAQALYGLAEKTDSAEREYLQKKSFRLAREVGLQSRAVDLDTIKARLLIGKMGPYMDSAEYVETLNGFNVFSMIGVPTIFEKQTLYKKAPESLAYTNSAFGSFKAAVERHQWDIDKITQELTARFNGHPERSVYLAERSLDEGKDEQALKILEEAVTKGEDAWKIYRSLGSMHISHGRYGAAMDAYLKYPYFSDIGNMNRVAVSNKAHQAGSRLFWLGRYEEARPLYEITAEMRTGSGAHFSSIQRLAMLERDFRKAIEYAYKRGQRYNNKFGYRDYLAFLHLIGSHKEADAGFRALVSRFRSPEVWTSQFVGQRIRDYSFKDYVDWAKDLVQGSDNPYMKYHAQSYLFRQSAVDREINPQHLSAVRGFSNIEKFAPRHKNTGSDLRPLFTSEETKKILRPCQTGEQECERGDPLSEYSGADFISTLMDAYQDLFAEKYRSSLRKFMALDEYYRTLDKKSAGIALPYLIMAASQVVPDEDLQNILGRLQEGQSAEGSEYEIALSESIVRSALGQNDEAFMALKRAFRNRPHTHSRSIYTWYEITSIAEWLSQRSGDSRYIDQALDWARRYQVIQPQFAWAYAFEALYAEDEEERVRAAAFAQYLDPNSAWLSKVPEAIRKKGAERWPELNPFILKQEKVAQPTAET